MSFSLGRSVGRRLRVAAAAFVLLGAAPPPPDSVPSAPAEPMALQPDSHDFVSRSDSTLEALGNTMRFGGINLGWLGLRRDAHDDVLYPTTFEINDALGTVQAMGSGVIRARTLGITADCPRCMVPSPGRINPDALRQIDAVLEAARDNGIKIIIPLSGPGDACPQAGALDPVRDVPCSFARWRHLPDAAFYADAGVRADFTAAVTNLLQHVNTFTGVAYKNDPTILAWENCDACGRGVDEKILAAWTEQLGRTIKSVDSRHLYENGAFAGRIGKHAAASVSPESLALPSVDIIGDRILPSAGDKPDGFPDAVDAVIKAGRVYVLDAYGWSPADWPTQAAFQAFLDNLAKNRDFAGALVSDMQGHADQGGYLPVPPGSPEPPLYFPGVHGGPIDFATMQARARAVRRYCYRMMDLDTPTFRTVDQPEIISAVHGKLVWRGSAGASTYSVERTGNLIESGSWQTVCDNCVTDDDLPWQDHAVPDKPTWYRVTPHNANGHAGIPSPPMQDK